ncbi:proproteinase E-like [Leucoraja erinacea]|uniref:proproteinase E-like n=1 Tax=Leucoraja erinaceus TaxID=7782 RepID=UPI002455A5E3|nr:proproteinase E-like [Leucoraja erinacea]
MYQLLLIVLLAARASACGMSSYPPYFSKVVNGIDARPYSWPWQVSLEVGYGNSFSHTCGGTLISSNWVMTAGHCISLGQTYRVVLGEYERHVYETGEQILNPSGIFVHPDWNEKCVSCGNDIALIKLSKEAILNDHVQLACIPPYNSVLANYAYCYITGWGRLSTNGQFAAKLQQAYVPVIDYAHCSNSDWWGSTVKKTMVCAGGAEKSGCNGDSGGPLNCKGSDNRWYVHGVNSFVSPSGCNTKMKPTVFTRVSAFNLWINQVMNSN